MTFYVYENWVADGHKATVHRANCGSCKDGKGVHPNAGPKCGKWHGAFATLKTAQEAAEKTGGTVCQCKRCLTAKETSA